MLKVSTRCKHLVASFIFAVFMLSAIFVGPQIAKAITVTYSEPVKYSVTTYEPYDGSSQQNTYYPHTTTTNGRSYINFSITPDTPAKKPLPETSETRQAVEKRTIAKGTKWATELYIIRSNNPGPTVMIVGGVHGNEPAGYKAAEQIKDWKIKKGTLLILPQANKRAIEINNRYVPDEGDLNRDFPRSSTELSDNILSRDIYNIVKKYDVDWLMDMHEGYDYYKNSSTNSVGQSLIYYPHNNVRKTAEMIVGKLNNNISRSYREFSVLRYPAKGSLARATAQFLGVNSFIFETCEKQRLSTRINYQIEAAQLLLQKLDMQ